MEFLQRLLDALEMPRINLVARSLSGYLALRFALAHPDRLNRLVIVAGAGFGRELPLALRLLNLPMVGELLYRPEAWSLQIRERTLYHDPTAVTASWLAKLQVIARQPGAKEFALKVVRMGTDLAGQRRDLYQPLLEQIIAVRKETLLIWGAQPQIEHASEFNRLVLDFLAESPG